MTARTQQNEAVIYCRVSSKKQVAEGNGLESQETACREYANRNGYSVLQVFRDDLTGKTDNRNGLKDLLAFIRKRKSSTKVVIDDLNRLARGLRAHFAIRDAIAAAGGQLESPKRIYGDDPEDDLLEVIEAAFAGEHRRKNAEQTRDRMRARCMGGYWCLQLPVGYRYYKVKGQGSLVERNEPVATIVQDALEAYACGHLQSQAEVARFLQKHPDFPRNAKGRVTDQKANDILTNVFYAGYVHVPNWDVSLRKGHHPALISMETHLRIQERLNGKPKVATRRDTSEDFPLRGFVLCDDCETPLTSCWAKGRNARYAYYHCREKDCVSYGKSIKREVIEGQFAELLSSLSPSRELAEHAFGRFNLMWQRRENKAAEYKAHLKQKLRKIEKDVSSYLDKIVEVENATVIKSYEKRINELELRKAETAERIARSDSPMQDFGTAFRTALGFLANPGKLWDSEHLAHKRIVLKLSFAQRLKYHREKGFRTALTSSPFTLLSALGAEIAGNGEMARPTGFEPVALRLGI